MMKMMDDLDSFLDSEYKEKEVTDVTTPVNSEAVPNNSNDNSNNGIIVETTPNKEVVGACSNGVVVTTYMQKIEITKYPNGSQFPKVTMWKVGAAQKTGKRKPKKKKSKSKKTVIQQEESY